MKSRKVEEKAADTILQKDEVIEIGRKKYHVGPVSVGTLIQVSRLVSRMPTIELNTETANDIVTGTLMIAKDCEVLGEIAATLVLGASKPNHHSIIEKVARRLKLSHEDKIKRLSNTILQQMSAKELNALVVALFSKMEISDFFGLTTSLLEVNVLRKTKEVG